MRIQKWWVAIMITIAACNSGHKKAPAYTKPGTVAEPDTRATPSTYLYNSTGMFLMDNGMILMLGADRPAKYKDSTAYLLNPTLNQPERGGKNDFHHKVP